MSVNAALGLVIVITVVVYLLVYSGGLGGSYSVSASLGPQGVQT